MLQVVGRQETCIVISDLHSLDPSGALDCRQDTLLILEDSGLRHVQHLDPSADNL